MKVLLTCTAKSAATLGISGIANIIILMCTYDKKIINMYFLSIQLKWDPTGGEVLLPGEKHSVLKEMVEKWKLMGLFDPWLLMAPSEEQSPARDFQEKTTAEWRPLNRIITWMGAGIQGRNCSSCREEPGVEQRTRFSRWSLADICWEKWNFLKTHLMSL